MVAMKAENERLRLALENLLDGCFMQLGSGRWCFRTHNGVAMGMGTKKEKLCRLADTALRSVVAPPQPSASAEPRKFTRGLSGHYAEHLSTHTKPPEECATCLRIERQMAAARPEAPGVGKRNIKHGQELAARLAASRSGAPEEEK